jgi:hypothetical protein
VEGHPPPPSVMERKRKIQTPLTSYSIKKNKKYNFDVFSSSSNCEIWKCDVSHLVFLARTWRSLF